MKNFEEITNRCNESISTADEASKLIDETEKIIGRIAKQEVDQSKERLSKRMTEPKPNHLTDDQWKKWLALGSKLLKI